jgi:hypothetical protein
MEQLKLSKINFGLTITLFAFSWIGGLALIFELTKREKEKSQLPINITMTPNTNFNPIKEEKITVPTKVQLVEPDKEKPDENTKKNKEKKIKDKPSSDKAVLK